MNILVIGSGGREHALAWKLSQSPRVAKVHVAPGNAGTAKEPGVENVPIAADDIDGLLAFAQRNDIALTVVGPEAPLVAGMVDRFQAAGLPCFGPDRQGARLEGSKNFSKEFLRRYGIPTAAHESFTDAARAIDYVRLRGVPIVIKADGLAAGKGVVLAHSFEQASAAISDMLESDSFGEAGRRIVIEEFLEGEEASFICIVAGEQLIPLASSQDHKARDEGDVGPNTGGMGAYSPAPVVDRDMHERILEQVIRPTVRGLCAEGIDYRGFLYAGVMIGPDGIPKVLEFNCRLGDPETQPILMRMTSDLVALLEGALRGNLHDIPVKWDARACLGVVMTAGGYPFDYDKGDVIEGLDSEFDADVRVFHGGTRIDQGQIVTDGGRVLCVTALGDTVSSAFEAAYAACDRIRWRNVYYRRDIGHRAITRESSRNH